MSDKTIYMAGKYDDGVTVSSQLSNGNNAVASGKYSHAEGKDTQASGEYAHSDGVNSVAKDDFSYVFNGNQLSTIESNGIGTYTVNTVNGVNGFFVGKKSLGKLLEDASGSVNILQSNNEFSGSNKFTALTRLTNTELFGNVILQSKTSTVNLSAGSVKVATPNVTSNDETAASTRFVHNLIQEYFKAILGNGVIRSNTNG